VDGTENKADELQFYTDMQVQTGMTKTQLRFFLSDLGDHKVILGYPWFAAVQPNIDWKRGWIDHTQLPIILWAPNAQKATFVPRTQNVPKPAQQTQYFIGRVTIQPGELRERNETPKLPTEYKRHQKVFDEGKSQRLPKHTIWDHAIELLPNAPATLPAKLLPLNQKEQEEMQKFMEEHLKRGTIQES
jgi:hypothetical protein